MQRNLFRRFLCFAVDDAAGGAGGGAAPSAPASTPAAPASAPASTPSPASGAGGTPPATVVSPAAGAPVAGTSGAPAAPAPTWLDNLKGAGLPVGKDDAETIAVLKQMHAERQGYESVRHLLPHVQSYLAEAQKYNEWKQQQSKAAPAPAAKSSNDPYWKESWQPPEYNQAWLQQITRDEKGNIVPVPGAPPDVVMKIQQYEQFRRDQAEKLLSNPFEFMAPMQKHLEERARAIAQEVIQQTMGNNQARQNALSFVEQNANWLFEIDPASKAPKQKQEIDPTTGQWRTTEVLSPWGERMARYADGVRKQQEARGYFDQAEVQNLAYAQVQRDYSTWLLQSVASGQMTPQQVQAMLNPGAAPPPAAGTPGVTPQQAANQTFLDKNNPAAASGGKGPPPAEEAVTAKTLRRELLKAFREGGITKETLKNSA